MDYDINLKALTESKNDYDAAKKLLSERPNIL